MAKVHFYDHVPYAWTAYGDGTVERKIATNQTLCGYVRDHVTEYEELVTCTHCLRKIRKRDEEQCFDAYVRYE
ncbi:MULTISPECIES: hypothetical protein [Vibrio]|uniref:hypothetical protein n=1 Tax=Vibrio TaxID=662 RepID=UPI000C861671|nr:MULTISPECIES: hypothetical protein [Vibrio]PMG63004.1 hypothetical protein BCU89_00090 [Vibrio splendidus]